MSSFSGLLIALCLAPILWSLAWCLRYLPVPIKNPAVRLIAIVGFAFAMVGILIAQILIYRWIAGIRVVGNDPIFMSATMLQNILTIVLIFSSARDRQRRTPQGSQP